MSGLTLREFMHVYVLYALYLCKHDAKQEALYAIYIQHIMHGAIIKIYSEALHRQLCTLEEEKENL